MLVLRFSTDEEVMEGSEWDPAKEAINEGKHGITFKAAARVFADSFVLVEESARPEHGELRYRAIGHVGSDFFTVIFTYRADQRRIISARRARRDERERYRLRASAF